jgi:ribosomal protein S18 acetylase RimI-like enzyme
MKDIKIRFARRKDIPQVAELWKDFADYHATLHPFFTRRKNAHLTCAKYFESSIGSRTRQLIVAVNNREIVGFVFVEISKYPPIFIEKQRVYLTDLFVSPDCRRHGIGRQLYLAALRWATGRGQTRIDLSVIAANKSAFAFWKKMGFDLHSYRMTQEI